MQIQELFVGNFKVDYEGLFSGHNVAEKCLYALEAHNFCNSQLADSNEQIS